MDLSNLPADVQLIVLEQLAYIRSGARDRYARIRRYDALGVPRHMVMYKSDEDIQDYLEERELLPEGIAGYIAANDVDDVFVASRTFSRMDPGPARVRRLKKEVASAKDLMSRIPDEFKRSRSPDTCKRAWDVHELGRVHAELGICEGVDAGFVCRSWFPPSYESSVALRVDRAVCKSKVRHTTLGIHMLPWSDPATVETVLEGIERVRAANEALTDVQPATCFAVSFKYVAGKFEFFLWRVEAFVAAALRLQRLVRAVEAVRPGLCSSGPEARSEYVLPEWMCLKGEDKPWRMGHYVRDEDIAYVKIPPFGKNRALAALSQIKSLRVAVAAARVSIDLDIDFSDLLWHLRGRERRVFFLDGLRDRLKIPNVQCLHAVAAALRTKFPFAVVNAFARDLSVTVDGAPVSWRDTLCLTSRTCGTTPRARST
jgi:hypothetical protein